MIRAAALVAFFLSLAHQTFAAEIEKVELFFDGKKCSEKFDSVECGRNSNAENSKFLHVYLKGDIAEGDADKIKRVINNHIPQRITGSLSLSDGAPLPIIHLNSLGGNLIAGVELAKLFMNHGLRTVIDQDAICASACAIAFMHGTIRGTHNYLSISRIIRPGGILGFHAPYRKFENTKTYTSKELEEFQKIQSYVTGYLLSISEDNYFPKALMAKMYAKDSDELYHIDTVDKAGRYGIILDTPIPNNLSYETLGTACLNEYAWRNKKSSIAHENQEGDWSIKWLPGQFVLNEDRSTLTTNEKEIEERLKRGSFQRPMFFRERLGRYKFLENGWIADPKPNPKHRGRGSSTIHIYGLTPYQDTACEFIINKEDHINVTSVYLYIGSLRASDENKEYKYVKSLSFYHPLIKISNLPKKPDRCLSVVDTNCDGSGHFDVRIPPELVADMKCEKSQAFIESEWCSKFNAADKSKKSFVSKSAIKLKSKEIVYASILHVTQDKSHLPQMSVLPENIHTIKYLIGNGNVIEYTSNLSLVPLSAEQKQSIAKGESLNLGILLDDYADIRWSAKNGKPIVLIKGVGYGELVSRGQTSDGRFFAKKLAIKPEKIRPIHKQN